MRKSNRCDAMDLPNSANAMRMCRLVHKIFDNGVCVCVVVLYPVIRVRCRPLDGQGTHDEYTDEITQRHLEFSRVKQGSLFNIQSDNPLHIQRD